MPNFDLNTTEGREAWLAERRKHVMSTDLPAILKMSPFKDATPLHVYLDKLGQYHRPDNKEMRWGRMCEETVAVAYQEETGQRVEPPDETLKLHPTLPLVGASIDRNCIVGGQRRLLELKWYSQRTGDWGDVGTDSVPYHVNLQVQTGMACADLHAADVGVVFGGSEFRWYTVRRNESIVRLLLKTAQDFWEQHVVPRVPPEPDLENPDVWKVMSSLYPIDPKKAIILNGDTLGVVELYEEMTRQERTAGQLKAKARAQLLERMGEAGVAFCGGRVLTRKPVHKEPYSVREQNYVELRMRQLKPGEVDLAGRPAGVYLIDDPVVPA